MSTYTGSLQPKKKQELQEIANALDIPDSGTREEIQSRIKHHLALHENTLSEEPRFAGLYGRTRKRSVQPQTQMTAAKGDVVSVSSEDQEEKMLTHARKVSRQVHLSRPREATPQNDSLRRVAEELEPADLPPLPPSPIPSAVVQAASAVGRDAAALMQKVKQQNHSMVLECRRMFGDVQTFLSDANNIYTITLLTELFFIIRAVLPMSYLHIPLNAPSKVENGVFESSSLILSLPYPTPAHLLSLAPWTVLARWIVPTLVLPLMCGALVSFSTPPREIDPLTVGIIRVACSVASRWGIEEDIFPAKWRVLSAAVGAAFAFAEAVGERRRAQS